MSGRRYTVLVADRSTGVLRRDTISLRVAISVVIAVLMMPVLMGLGAKWSARHEISELRAMTTALTVSSDHRSQRAQWLNVWVAS